MSQSGGALVHTMSRLSKCQGKLLITFYSMVPSQVTSLLWSSRRKSFGLRHAGHWRRTAPMCSKLVEIFNCIYLFTLWHLTFLSASDRNPTSISNVLSTKPSFLGFHFQTGTKALLTLFRVFERCTLLEFHLLQWHKRMWNVPNIFSRSCVHYEPTCYGFGDKHHWH